MSSNKKKKRGLRKEFWKKKNILIWGLIVGLFFLSIAIFEFLLMPQIHLKGNKNLVMDYEKKYKEKGYKATFLGDDITKEVKVEGKVNEKKLGNYTLTYQVKVGPFKRQVKRYVSVKDREKPIIEINEDDIYVCPGSEVVREKVEAHDNYDKDLTDKVQSIVEKDRSKITYKVVDSSGNEQSVTKKIIYKDIESPIITLNGNELINLFIGEEYQEQGVEAKDNCDGDIKDKVEIEGKVNTNEIGEYEINYSVSDQAGNHSDIKRKVKIKEKTTNGTIYLTFDDGPNAKTTDVILDILKEEGVKATFFVTNKGPDELIKREYEEGHTVALHTATHDYATVYASYDAYFQDLNTVSDRVKRITGYESKIIRFPGGSSNTVSRKYTPGIMSYLTEEVQRRGYRYYDWNISSGDAGSTTDPNVVYSNVVEHLRQDRANMVLMHDIKTYTRDALRNIIHYGKENGYHFEPITMDTEMVHQKVNN